jgi:ribosomal protein S27E
VPDFITLSCPSCGHKLQIAEDVDRFACAACGKMLIIDRSGGNVIVKPMLDGITKIQASEDKTDTELAIGRLNREISDLEEDLRTIKAKDFKKMPQSISI